MKIAQKLYYYNEYPIFLLEELFSKVTLKLIFEIVTTILYHFEMFAQKQKFTSRRMSHISQIINKLLEPDLNLFKKLTNSSNMYYYNYYYILLLLSIYL